MPCILGWPLGKWQPLIIDLRNVFGTFLKVLLGLRSISVVTISTTVLSLPLIYLSCRDFGIFNRGAKSGLYLLKLGKLHHLGSADVFLASIFSILVNTGGFKSLMAFTAWKTFNLMPHLVPHSRCKTVLQNLLQTSYFKLQQQQLSKTESFSLSVVLAIIATLSAVKKCKKYLLVHCPCNNCHLIICQKLSKTVSFYLSVILAIIATLSSPVHSPANTPHVPNTSGCKQSQWSPVLSFFPFLGHLP